ncbi:hypothetical protein [Desulfosporosinus hippei]|uniref:hypothetical protein n=1 Tax=Desulfosporosinus hippei TaxID=569859 RepID=UPI000B85135C|nr:hypothetical protein [Desulfosporosinus hippei]
MAISSSAYRVRSTLQENASGDAVWRKAHLLFVYRTRKLRIHIAGVCVTSRNVAKGLPFATKRSFGVGGSAILSTGHYRAFRSRADDTWGIAPGKVGSTLQEFASRDAVWRKAHPPFVSPGNKRKAISE